MSEIAVGRGWRVVGALAGALVAPVFGDFGTMKIAGDAVSRTLSRGEVLDDGPALQPSLEWSLGALTLGAWGSWSLRGGAWSELDYTASWTQSLPFAPRIDLVAGYSVCTFPQEFDVAPGAVSTEVAAGIALDAPSAPAASWVFDPQAGHYWEGSISHEAAPLDWLGWDASLSAGYLLARGEVPGEWSGEPTVLAAKIGATWKAAVDVHLGLLAQEPLSGAYRRDLALSAGVAWSIGAGAR